MVIDGVELSKPALAAVLSLLGGDTHTATYSIDEDIMTFTMPLLEDLTGYSQLTAVRV